MFTFTSGKIVNLGNLLVSAAILYSVSVCVDLLKTRLTFTPSCTLNIMLQIMKI